MSISVLLSVYNEECRIESTLKTLQWCDEIIILDKNSTDNTRVIAQKYGAKVFIWNSSEYDYNEISFLLEKCTSEWIIGCTASDIIHPKLALEIKKLTSKSEFEFDIIYVPFRTYILGIDSKRSPWHTDFKPIVYRKHAVKLNIGVHDAMQFNSCRNFRIMESDEICIYHLTHVNVDIMMDRHVRYWRAEAQYFEEFELNNPFKRVIKEFLRIVFKKKSFLIGWDGVMLSFAYLSYYMMSFVYKWEKEHSKAPEVYDKIRNDILSEWKVLEK